ADEEIEFAVAIDVSHGEWTDAGSEAHREVRGRFAAKIENADGALGVSGGFVGADPGQQCEVGFGLAPTEQSSGVVGIGAEQFVNGLPPHSTPLPRWGRGRSAGFVRW